MRTAELVTGRVRADLEPSSACSASTLGAKRPEVFPVLDLLIEDVAHVGRRGSEHERFPSARGPNSMALKPGDDLPSAIMSAASRGDLLCRAVNRRLDRGRSRAA